MSIKESVRNWMDSDNEIGCWKVIMNALWVADCSNDLVWIDKYMIKETKSKIYKATVSSFMTYALKTRAEAIKNQILEANEMEVQRKIKIDRLRSQQMRESCGIQPID